MLTGRRIVYLVLIGIVSFLMGYESVTYIFPSLDTTSDTYIRNRVLLLDSEEGECTGVEVLAPSGKAYVLTAAHCYPLVRDFKIHYETEDGSKGFLTFVDIKREVDLMLFSAPGETGVMIADSIYKHEKVHTLTHGAGMWTYRSDGEVVFEFDMQDGGCPQDSSLRAPDALCLLDSVKKVIITAQIYPGSSGGPVVNDEGQLVAIAQQYKPGTFFSIVSTVDDIKNILKGR